MESNNRKTKVITIDGPAGAGKSTIAKKLAKVLGISYLDTGAMYRALTFNALRSKVDLSNKDKLIELASKCKIDIEDKPEGLNILLNGEDVSQEIRTAEVTNNTFYIAGEPKIREIMVNLQREIGSRKDVVVEGRDIGTVVFPESKYKFYLDADFEERSKRRLKELVEKGQSVDAENLKNDLRERDNKDFTRKVGPLKKAEDAIIIDSTNLSIDQVVEEILKNIDK